MTENVTAHKKIYQIAKEINISHETLIDYLKRKGHTVKGLMSSVDDAMMHDILSHFKKDREVAEKHQRKIQTIRETRKKAEAKAAIPDVSAQKLKPVKKTKAEEAEQPALKPAAAAANVVSQPVPLEASPAVDVMEPPGAHLPSEAQTVEPLPEKAPAKERKAPEVMARRTPKMGLKIK